MTVTLAKGGKAVHELELGPYVGAVRLMVVAGNKEGAFGSRELEVPVRAELMAYLTAPRVLGPGERLTVPVSLLGFMGKGSQATVSMKVEGQATIVGESSKIVRWAEEGEQAVSFEVAVGEQVGAVRLTVEAAGPGGRVSRQSVDIPVRSSAIPVTAVFPSTLAAKATGTLDAEMPGMPGSNEAWLELSLAPPIDLSGRLAYLIGYPHGCGEQVTSKAFPQLFLGDAMNLSPEQSEAARANVAAAITKLAGFQLGSGGFVFWPGSYEESPWLSAYVTHFLTMARRQGFTVPDSMMNPALAYLRTQARAWNAQQDYSKAEQAYRLYTLALVGVADIASMNRFIEYSPFPVGAQYQLAAAYALAGMKDRSRAVLKDAPVDATRYDGIDKVYGSLLRDRAIILDAYNALGDSTRGLPLYRKLADDLSSDAGWSTQDLSFALVAALPYLKSQASGSTAVRYSYAGGSGTVTLTKAMARIPLDAGSGTLSLKLENASAAQVFARVVATGTPEPGAEQTRSEGLAIAVRYLDGSERAVDPAREPFGSDLIAEISVRNTSGEPLTDVALTYRTASGWELANLRVGRSGDEGSAPPEGAFDYQDIRDDRVMTYFSIARGASKRFRFNVNKTYEGLYFLPAVNAEAMYRPEIFAVVPGRLLSVPKSTPSSNPNSRSGKP